MVSVWSWKIGFLCICLFCYKMEIIVCSLQGWKTKEYI